MIDFLASLNWTAIIVTLLICTTTIGVTDRFLRMMRIHRDVVRMRYGLDKPKPSDQPKEQPPAQRPVQRVR